MLELMNISKSYGAVMVMKDVSLTIKEGDICLLYGNEGAGKTTVLEIAAGIIRPDQGSVNAGGENLLTFKGKRKYRIGYVPQQFSLYQDQLVKEYVQFFCNIFGFFGRKAKLVSDQTLELVDLAEQANREIRDLNMADKKKLSFARALISNPDILILDEIIVGLPEKDTNMIIDNLKGLSEMKKIILISSRHTPNIVELSTKLVKIENGNLMVSERVMR